MSGGHFEYDQHRIEYIVHEIERLIDTNDDDGVDEHGFPRGSHYSPEIITKFQEAVQALRRAYVYAQRIDWLVSGDDGPEAFLERLERELNLPTQLRTDP